jgi:hypothetical protein
MKLITDGICMCGKPVCISNKSMTKLDYCIDHAYLAINEYRTINGQFVKRTTCSECLFPANYGFEPDQEPAYCKKHALSQFNSNIEISTVYNISNGSILAARKVDNEAIIKHRYKEFIGCLSLMLHMSIDQDQTIIYYKDTVIDVYNLSNQKIDRPVKLIIRYKFDVFDFDFKLALLMKLIKFPIVNGLSWIDIDKPDVVNQVQSIQEYLNVNSSEYMDFVYL